MVVPRRCIMEATTQKGVKMQKMSIIGTLVYFAL